MSCTWELTMRVSGACTVVAVLANVVSLLVESRSGDGGGKEQASDDGLSVASEKHLEIYKHLFSLKRREHIETAVQVQGIDDYAKQYKTVTFVIETIFPVLTESMAKINEVGYTPNSPFPEDQNMREVLGKVYENVAFFGDFVLRMPDITKKIYRKHKEWYPILKWAVGFCNDSGRIFDGSHATQLHLLSQEIGLIPEEPNYVNPFRATAEEQEAAAAIKKQKGAKKRKNSSKGPKLRGARYSEL